MRTVEEWEYELAGRVGGVEWNGHDGEADEEGVAEVQGGHGGEFVGKTVVGPD